MTDRLSDERLRFISERLRVFAAAVTDDERPCEVGVAAAAGAIDELIDARAEIARLHAVIERDRTAVATGAQAISTAISSYRWLMNSRGPYEWDDDRWMKEFSDAIDAIEKALDPLRRITVDTSDCPANWADVVAAREGRN